MFPALPSTLLLEGLFVLDEVRLLTTFFALFFLVLVLEDRELAGVPSGLESLFLVLPRRVGFLTGVLLAGSSALLPMLSCAKALLLGTCL